MKKMKNLCKERLEGLYNKYNKREFVHPDPLEFLYDYEDLYDREIVGLIASSLAYGRVEQILKSVAFVLNRLPTPSDFLRSSTSKSLYTLFIDFKHRFTTGKDLATMLVGIKGIIEKYGSIYKCFIKGLKDEETTVIPALYSFIKELSSASGCDHNSLIPSVDKGSACKRLNLFLRWMVRNDMIDPGGWSEVPPSKLIVPLDIHLHRICLKLNATKRRQADMRTACEITSFFKEISPEDPVKYDFVLTRFGIWKKKIDIGITWL